MCCTAPHTLKNPLNLYPLKRSCVYLFRVRCIIIILGGHSFFSFFLSFFFFALFFYDVGHPLALAVFFFLWTFNCAIVRSMNFEKVSGFIITIFVYSTCKVLRTILHFTSSNADTLKKSILLECLYHHRLFLNDCIKNKVLAHKKSSLQNFRCIYWFMIKEAPFPISRILLSLDIW